jgi:hypothetical protein
MARGSRVTIEIEDVRGSFARLIKEAPKAARRFLSTAVFQTAAAVQREQEARYNMGPEGQGLTPDQHIKLDVEHRGRTGSLHAQVGIFDDADQVQVAMLDEWKPNKHGVQKQSAVAESEPFKKRAIDALQKCERYLSQGF